MTDFGTWRKTWDGRTPTLLTIIAECAKDHPRKDCIDAWNDASGRISPAIPRTPPSGPGTELKALLASFGIHPKGCHCNSKAMLMDRNGPDWCEAHLNEITGWLLEQAAKRRWMLRNLPFLPSAAQMLVRLAIAKARAATGPS